MAINITTSRIKGKTRRILCYGEAGKGKTWLIQTLPKPLIISADKGLLTLEECKEDFPVWEVSTIADIEEAMEKLTSDSASLKDIETICIDGWTAIAEIALAEYGEPDEKGKKPHGQVVYGALGTFGKKFLKFFRDFKGRHVYMTASMTRHDDEYSGISRWSPSLPGATLRTETPHYFDLVLALKMDKHEGKEYRYLQTQPSVQYYAKDRSGKLAAKERPHLGYILNKTLTPTQEK